MPDYTLYYWPIPFRGQFVRAVLAHVGASWDEASVDDLVAQKAAEPADQLVPFMGPPVLTDHAAGSSLSQMPAILAWLGASYRLIPDDAVRAAMTHKIVADASDVLYEATRSHGAQMWTREAWADYLPRLERWMAMFEATGHRYGLTAQAGHLLGTDAPGIADLATATLWGTMTARLPSLRPMLEDAAPAIAGLCDRIAALPEQAELRQKSDAAYGDAWCGGQIEASLRSVV